MYQVDFMPKAVKDLKKLPREDAKNILSKIMVLESGLAGSIKKLTNFTPEYRLRVGNYRVLFEIDGKKIIVYCIKHRKDAYMQR